MNPARNLADCWWQIPPFGKDFHAFGTAEIGKFLELSRFLHSGTALV
jgi:hypothetical protein